MNALRYPATALLVAAIAAAVMVIARERPVRVEVARVSRGPLSVDVMDEGLLRVRDRYVVDAPVAGTLRRPALKAGDRVVAGRTVVAVIDPAATPLLDPRERERAQARVDAAHAAVARARAEAKRVDTALALARRELARLRHVGTRSVPERDIDRAAQASRMEELEHVAALQAVRGAEAELADARTALERPAVAPQETVVSRAPVTGVVLRVHQESAAAVQAGMRLLELGDVTRLECVVDLLSSDAARVRAGQPVRLVRWGGERALAGVVRRVEPQARTKVSPLGVEEQRVDVLIDVSGKIESGRAVADGWAVDAYTRVWHAADVRRLPLGALFRDRGAWAVLVVEGDRAARRAVRVGELGDEHAEVRAGLTAGELVILHPGDRVRDGMLVYITE